MVASAARPSSVNTLAFDIGGTGLKASVLDQSGHMEHERVKIDTPYPLSPQKLVMELQKLIADLPPFDRVSVGFPGMVRDGKILSAPHFVSPSGPGGKPEPKLVKAWASFDLAGALTEVTGKPTKVANDADIQGAAVVTGKGFEVVITLGTGVGTAFFMNGQLLPHLEFAHHPYNKKGSYNDALGEAARKKLGNKKWAKEALAGIETIRALTFFDHCFVGGGNSARLPKELPEGVSVVDNAAGILGGIKLWERTSTLAPLGDVAAVPAPAASKSTRRPTTATRATTAGRTTAGRTTATRKAAPAKTVARRATTTGGAPAATRTTRTRKAAPPSPAADPTPTLPAN
jgi:polyphosphate glucokinase